MNFFFDRTAGRNWMEGVRALQPGHHFAHHNQDFDENTTDEHWIKAVAGWNGKWFVISADRQRVENRAKVQVLKSTRLSWFAFVGRFAQMKFPEQLAFIGAVWRRILVLAEREEEPTIYKVGMYDEKPQVKIYKRLSEL